MGERSEGLSLRGLAERMEALERENAELRNEVVALRGSDARRNGPAQTSGLVPLRDGARASGFEGRVSRRSLLGKAGVAAAGLVVAGALTQTDVREAKAAQIIGDSNQEFRGGVEGTNDAQFGYGLMGRATDGWGVDGQADRAGVRGSSAKGIGVEGSGNTTGVQGQGKTGVYGLSSTQDGYGVEGLGGSTGVYGVSDQDGSSGVIGRHSTSTVGYGVKGEGKGSGYAGVVGVTGDGGGYGVWGLGSTDAGTGVGVYGYGDTGVRGQGRGSGYGGTFEGGRAQIKLTPKGTAGRPKSGSHQKGEVYVDSNATLFVCTKSGTPGTWRKVTTTSA